MIVRAESNTYMCVETFDRRVVATYSKGKIQKVDVRIDEEGVAFVTVSSVEGEFLWTTDKIFIVAYMRFGIPVSQDGKYLFAQQDRRGMICFEAKTGKVVWKTKSKAEIAHVLVRKDHLCCSKARDEIQLIDIESGEILKSYRTPFDNRFKVLSDDIIFNHTRAKSWEVISAENLEIIETILDCEIWQRRDDILKYKNRNISG